LDYCKHTPPIPSPTHSSSQTDNAGTYQHIESHLNRINDEVYEEEEEWEEVSDAFWVGATLHSGRNRKDGRIREMERL
jgi:hypothetical protein